jgi:putative colanic acid biosynthesis UDP-glucose lipid carrier transferase
LKKSYFILIQLRKKYYYLLRLLIDFLAISIAYFVAILLTTFLLKYTHSFISIQPVYFASLLIWYISSKVFYLYNDITLVSFSQEVVSLIKVAIFHILLLVFLLFIFKLQDIFRGFIIIYGFLLFLFIVIEKYLYRVIYAKTRKNNENIKSTLVVGNKNIANFLNGSNLSNNNLNLNIVGILNDDDDGKNGYKLLGSIQSIHQILQEINVDQVLVCLPIDEEEKIDFIVSVCEKENILVSILTSPTNQFGIGTKRVMNYANIPILFFKNYPLDDYENQLFKRIFDIIFSIFVIIFIFSWLFPIVYLFIKFTSKGPVFFNQYRWGINNERIKCYKFRTMFIGSNELSTDGSYMPAQRDDQRITPIGKFLRKTSIDEMPQFFNVLIGSMSVVGPRPHPIPLNIQSKEQIHNYLLRHLVKPGITGWAQVNGNRGEVKELSDMQDRVNFDIWYIENWTLWLDIQIIFQTIINLIKGDEKAF